MKLCKNMKLFFKNKIMCGCEQMKLFQKRNLNYVNKEKFLCQKKIKYCIITYSLIIFLIKLINFTDKSNII